MTRITAPSPTPSTSPTEQSDASYVPSERSDRSSSSFPFVGPYDAHLSNRWTRQEEEVLFDCVARHSRGGWPLIADDFDANMSMGMDEGSPRRVRRTIGAMQHNSQSMRGEMVRRALAVQRMEKKREEEDKAEPEAEVEAKEESWHKRLGKAMVAFNSRNPIAGSSNSTAAGPERMSVEEATGASAAAGQQGTHGQNGSKEPATGTMALSKWQAGVQGEQREAIVTAGRSAAREVSRSGEV